MTIPISPDREKEDDPTKVRRFPLESSGGRILGTNERLHMGQESVGEPEPAGVRRQFTRCGTDAISCVDKDTGART
jgi:hypothetical protein